MSTSEDRQSKSKIRGETPVRINEGEEKQFGPLFLLICALFSS
jgi:hypothetical protein